MEIFVYRNGNETVEENFTVADLPALLAETNSVIWVDMEKPTLEDDQILSDVFKFHPLTIEDCRANRHHPKVEEFPGYLYFIVHGVLAETNAEHFETIELDGFLGQNFVITYHHDNFRSINMVKQRVRTSPIACQRGASYLLHQILDQIVDFYSPVMDDFDRRITKIEDRIFNLKSADDKVLSEIMNIKRNLMRLRRNASKQLDIIYRMSKGEFVLIDQQMLPFYRDIHDHLVRVMDLTESYRDLIGSSLDTYLSVISNRMNEVMKLLAVFSAIMLPLTFIAGVYGMNFDNMPELHSSVGYFSVLAAMLIIAVGMLIFFWRKGWIGNNNRYVDEDKDAKGQDKVNTTET